MFQVDGNGRLQMADGRWKLGVGWLLGENEESGDEEWLFRYLCDTEFDTITEAICAGVLISFTVLDMRMVDLLCSVHCIRYYHKLLSRTSRAREVSIESLSLTINTTTTDIITLVTLLHAEHTP